MLLALALALSTSVSPNPCDRRADVVAIREAAHAGADGLATARARADAAARALPAGRARGCAAAVAAEAAIHSDDKAATLNWLDEVIAALPELADAVRPHRALLLLELGRAADARRELAAIDPRSAWHERLAWRLADKDEADRILRRRASRDVNALATLCERGDRASCATLLVRHPGHPAARAAKTTASPPSRSPAGRAPEEPRGRARPLRAIEEGLPIARRNDIAAADRVHVDALIEHLANALWRAERTAEALDVTARFVDEKGHVIVPVAKARARTFARLGRFAEASQAWGVVRDDVTVAREVRAEAAFFAGFALVEIATDAVGVAAAEAAFDLGAPIFSDSGWQEQATWYRAFLRLTVVGDAAAAEPLLATLATTKTEPRKYRYWRAQALEAQGRAKEGRALLLALTKEEATDWYGLLARRALGLPPVAGTAVAADALMKQAPDDDDARLTRLLFALGFDDEAKQGCRARAAGKRSPSLAEVGLCQQVDDPSFGWRYGGFFTPRVEVKGDRLVGGGAWRASFARPWAGLVDDAAMKAGVPASFIMGIMRTESGFDATAVSIAGARGLMQLLPSVARTTATVSSLPPSLSARLHDPDGIIPLGAHLLGRLAREHGSILMAAAAYNAGPGPASTWAARFGHLPVDRFVERISFKETRNYVKKVLAAEALYRALDGGPLLLDLPATITPAQDFTRLPYDE
jgi:soluble lytic murein transglycosylase